MLEETASPFPETAPVAAPAESTTTVAKTVTESTTVGPAKPDQSTILNCSVRAWLALMVIWTLCWCQVNGIEVKEPFYTISIAVVSVFFVQAAKPKTQTQ